MKCTICGKENSPEATACDECGTPLNIHTENEANPINKKEKVSFGWKLLSFCFPLIGLILFVVKKKDSPAMAKTCGKSALIGFILSIVMSIVMTVISVVFVFSKNAIDEGIADGTITVNGEVVEDYDEDYFDSGDNDFDFEDEIPGIDDGSDEMIILEPDIAEDIPAIE